MFLDLQMSLFKLIMKNNVALAIGCPYIMNPMIWLRKSLAFSQMIAHKMLKYVKLVTITMVQMINFVEDTRCFNNLNSIKLKLRNQLTTHLELVVWMFVQQFYTLKFFSYLHITNFQYYEISIKSMQNS